MTAMRKCSGRAPIPPSAADRGPRARRRAALAQVPSVPSPLRPPARTARLPRPGPLSARVPHTCAHAHAHVSDRAAAVSPCRPPARAHLEGRHGRQRLRFRFVILASANALARPVGLGSEVRRRCRGPIRLSAQTQRRAHHCSQAHCLRSRRRGGRGRRRAGAPAAAIARRRGRDRHVDGKGQQRRALRRRSADPCLTPSAIHPRAGSGPAGRARGGSHRA